jgi:hypothetical protein
MPSHTCIPRQRTCLLPHLGHVSWRYCTRCWSSRSCTANTIAALTSKTDKQLQQCSVLLTQHTCTVSRDRYSTSDTVSSTHSAHSHAYQQKHTIGLQTVPKLYYNTNCNMSVPRCHRAGALRMTSIHVAVWITTYVQFVIQLCASVGTSDWLTVRSNSCWI